MALKASEKLYEARELCARLFFCPDPEGVTFTLNATYALNMAVFGLVGEGDHVLISDLEHNSTLRCVEHLKRTKNVAFSVFSTEGNVQESIEAGLRNNTKALICTHASNITNRVLPLEKIGKLLKKRGVLFIVDASQSAGSHKIDMEQMEIDALCLPGHKGLLGPQGIGIAVFSPSVKPQPLVHGGSGSHSRLPSMPDHLPDRMEAGTLPTPAAAGLCEGIRYVLEQGEEGILRRETELMRRMSGEFENDRRIFTYSSGDGPIWLFNIKGVPSQKTARMLDSLGVCVRPGLHCAPLAHRTLTTPEDGAVRVSTGPLTCRWQAEHFCKALKRVADETCRG